MGNPPADKDSKHVALLRQLGAIPIGKTNVPYVSYHPISQCLMIASSMDVVMDRFKVNVFM